MKKLLVLFISVLYMTCYAQQVRELNDEKIQYPLNQRFRHSGFWVTHPDIDVKQYNVVLFRKTFSLAAVPSTCIIHISADNLYRLYINGKFVCMGPARDDYFHWNYETIDIAPFLQKGDNVIAAQVNNFGHRKANAQFSYKTGLLIVAHERRDSVLNSDDKTWKTMVNKAYVERPVEWMYAIDIVNGWYCINPCDTIKADKYPWGWQQLKYNDSEWKKPLWLASFNLRYDGSHGPLLLEPRDVKLLQHKQQRLASVARTEGIEIKQMPFNGKDSLVIPAHKKVTILIDNKILAMGFPEMIASKGKGSTIKVQYSECLFGENLMKGNRNELSGKRMIGLYDVFMPDGGSRRNYQTLWYRPFRFVQIEVKTADEPLVINDFYNIHTAYPFEEKASFDCGDPIYKKIQEVGWRTVSLCSQDFYMSDAYYETMQYFADTRIHGLVTATVSGDYSLYKQAIIQFNNSRIPDGLTLAAYPNDWHWVLPYFSLMWVDMVHDYTMITGDKAFAKEMLPGVQAVLAWFGRHINDKGILGKLEWANPNGSEENSSMFTLYYAYSLKNTARVLAYTGSADEASRCTVQAENLVRNVMAHSWDAGRGLLAETPDKKVYSQWPNIMAVLTDAVPTDQQKDLLRKAIKELGHVGYIESFYLFEAMKKTGLSDELFDSELAMWKSMINDEGLSTFKEVPGNHARSDCHPWSTCPVYYLYTIVCGIEPMEPGYTKVRIAPSLGKQNFVNGTMPVPAGMISLALKRNGKTGIKGTVTIPASVSGEFVWNKQTVILKGGTQIIEIK